VAEFTSRLAVSADVPTLTVLMDAAIAELQRAFLDDAEIASSRAIGYEQIAAIFASRLTKSVTRSRGYANAD
jgi:hypothetical protein